MPELIPSKVNASKGKIPSISFCKKTFIIILVTIIYLFASELITRLYFYQKIFNVDRKYLLLQYNYTRTPYLGFEPEPSTRYYNANIGMTVNVNALGFRGDEITIDKAPGTIRLAFFGGSSTYGTGISTNHKTWPYLLGKKLEKTYPNKKIETIIAAVPAYNTMENLIRLQLRILELNPDVVFLYNVHNDLKRNNAPGFKSDYSHMLTVQTEPNFFSELLLHSVLYLKIRNRLRILNMQSVMHDNLDPEAWRVYRRNVDSIIGICKIRNIKVVLLTYVTSYTDYSEAAKTSKTFKEYWGKRKQQVRDVFYNLTISGVEKGFKRYNKGLLELAEKEEGVFSIDTAKLFPEQEKWGHMRDLAHFDDIGADIFSNILTQEVKKLSLLESLPSPIIDDYDNTF